MKSLHPKIDDFFRVILVSKPDTILSEQVLKILKSKEATATEAAIVLHMGFDVDLDEASDFVAISNMFPYEEVNDVAYQTFLYLYYERQ